MKRRIMKAQNNNHFVQLFEDFPELTAVEVGRRLGVSGTSIGCWHKGHRECPLWTVALVEKFRQEYAESKESSKVKRANKSVVQQKELAVEPAQTLCIICGPRNKLDKLTTVLSIFGYSILDSE